MSWVKIDDRANEHRKQLAAGPAASWLWACGLMYCNRQEVRTGVVPLVALPVLFPGANKRLADKLVEVGLWEPTDTGYMIHNYFEFQPSNEELAERKRSKTEAGRLGGLRSGEARRKHAASPLLDVCLKQNEANTKPDPDPDPDPMYLVDSPPATKRKATKGSTVPGDDTQDGWLTSPELETWSALHGLSEHHQAQTEEWIRFLRYHKARGTVFKSWRSAWANWDGKRFISPTRAPYGKVMQNSGLAPHLEHLKETVNGF